MPGLCARSMSQVYVLGPCARSMCQVYETGLWVRSCQVVYVKFQHKKTNNFCKSRILLDSKLKQNVAGNVSSSTGLCVVILLRLMLPHVDTQSVEVRILEEVTN